jgi:adenylosuccinate synthase
MKGWKIPLDNIQHYEDFPQEFKDYIQFIEEEVGVPISIISIGPDRKQTVLRNMVNA